MATAALWSSSVSAEECAADSRLIFTPLLPFSAMNRSWPGALLIAVVTVVPVQASVDTFAAILDGVLAGTVQD